MRLYAQDLLLIASRCCERCEPLQKKIMHRIEYVGRLRGDAILSDVKRSRDGERPSLLAEALSNSNVVMYLKSDYSELSAMENPQSSELAFYNITHASKLLSN